MKIALAIILIAVGAVLFIQGLNRKESVAGHLDQAGTAVANTLDGGARTTRHAGYMIAGGVLVLVGIVLAVRRTPGSPIR
jgi:hypothetical protein